QLQFKLSVCPDDQCSPSSATCKCPSVPYQCTSMPHISAHLSCLSVSPISASQCHLSMPISTTSISAHQCRLTVPYISAAFQYPSVMPVNAHQCHHLPVPPHQCPSVPPISAAYQCPSV
ncbi:unnamed protein product, partial [Staurois parvus]